MFNMKLFIDTDADSRLSKRVLKDVDELGRDLDQVFSFFLFVPLMTNMNPRFFTNTSTM